MEAFFIKFRVCFASGFKIDVFIDFGSILVPFWLLFRSLGPAYYKIGENVKTSVSPLRFVHLCKTRDSEMCSF